MRKPERQWRQVRSTVPTQRSTQRPAAYHKSALKTAGPNYRTDSATWRGSSTPPLALSPRKHRPLHPPRRYTTRRPMQQPLPRPTRHRPRTHTPHCGETPQLGRQGLMTPLPKPGPQPPRRHRVPHRDPLRRPPYLRSNTGSLVSHHGQPRPPMPLRRNPLRAPWRRTAEQHNTICERPSQPRPRAKSLRLAPHRARRQRKRRHLPHTPSSHPPQYRQPEIDTRLRPRTSRPGLPRLLENALHPRRQVHRRNRARHALRESWWVVAAMPSISRAGCPARAHHQPTPGRRRASPAGPRRHAAPSAGAATPTTS